MDTGTPQKDRRRGLIRVVKWVACALVLAFVGQRASTLVNSDELSQLRIDPVSLVLSGIVYALGWLPSVWFWRQMMIAHGQNPPVSLVTRAYYCGHLGKYIPGKATVLLIRGGMLNSAGYRFSTAALTAAYETLASMGAGLAVGLAMLPWLITRDQLPAGLKWMSFLLDPQWMMSALLITIAILSTPLVAKILNRVATSMSKDVVSESQREVIEPSFVLIGVVVFCVSWWIMGLSLGLAIQGISDVPWDLSDWPRWTGATALATSLGFIAIFAPGGVGVREAVLMEILGATPGVGSEVAVAVAIVLRLVWLVTELAISGLLFLAIRPAAHTTDDEPVSVKMPLRDHQSVD